MNMLVPTDFSPCANHALGYAALLAKRTNQNLTLVHVYTTDEVGNAAMIEYVEKETDAAKQNINKKLAELSQKVADESGVTCRHALRVGGLTEGILEEAKQTNSSMIVMGTEGASGLTKLLFGSRTNQVIERSDNPVLAVPAQTTLALPKKIVFATNFLDSDLSTLKQLVEWARPWHPEIFLLHVSHENMRSERDYIETFSLSVIGTTNYKHVYYYVLPHDSDERGIELFITSVSADMLVLSTRKRSFIERLFSASLTKRIAYHLQVPLLAFHTRPSDSQK
jgi:nucleotide-binding universal stress UspA family protein